MDAGCGGIDIYAGGFSFINRDELINTLKDIGANSTGYAFLLALETISPQIANTITQLQSWSNSINEVGINSCEVASHLVGAAWPAKTAAKERICQAASTSRIWGSSWIENRQECGKVETQNTETRRFQSEKPSLLTTNYNIAWEALKKQTFVSQDKELMEMMMTLLGTIISTNDNGNEYKEFLPAKINDEMFYKTLLSGGLIQMYRCKDKNDDHKENRCLLVKLELDKLDFSRSWIGHIQETLESVQYKILHENDGCKLTKEEIDLMTRTRLPLFHVVNVITAYRQGECPSDLNEVAEIIATDLLMQYIREAVIAIREGCEKIKKEQMYTTEIDEYLASIYRAEEQLRYYDIKEGISAREYFAIHEISGFL